MRFWHWILRRREEERELEEELRFHLAEETRLRMDRGQSEEAARLGARRDFGNITTMKEVSRQMWGWTAVERAAHDLRFAARMLIRNGGFTVLSLLALALGIGATSAVFTVVRSVLLRPLVFPDPSRLVMVWERQPSGRQNVVQTQNFLDWRARNRSFENISAMLQISMNLETGGEAVQIPGLRTTAGFFEILGTPPMLGRTLRREDDLPDAPAVVVLSYGFWQRLFGGRAGAVGQRLILGGRPAEVIGVMPAEFVFPTTPRAALFAPLRIDPAQAPRDGRNFSTVARLRPGIPIGQAQAEMEAIAAQTAAERPAMNKRWSALVTPLIDQTVKDSRTALLVLMCAVFFVLLIACANVSNLLLMRASARRREMTVRLALGAGRWRLVHQLLMESLLLSAIGGGAGFLLARWGVPAIIRSLPAGFPLPRLNEIAVDPTILAFTIVLSIGCGLVFGIAPAVQAGGGSVSEGLRQGGRSASGGNRPLRNALVVAEVALAMLLVIGAGLMLRSFALLNATNPGFRAEHLLTVRMTLFPQFQTIRELVSKRRALVQQVLERVRALPQVTSASSIHILPMTGGNSGTPYARADRPLPPPGAQDGGDVSIVSDDYFHTMGIPIVAGREFNLHDREGALAVAILNQSAARHFYPGEDPIGKRMKVDWGPNNVVEVVGVSADIRHSKLDAAPEMCLFMPQAQQPQGLVSLLIRTAGEPTSLSAAVKDQIRAVSPGQGTAQVESMEQVMADSIARPRLEMVVLAIFGVLALTLACLGIYAVISYSVEQRMREMGIRLALGAAPGGILGMVLREGLLLAGIGIGLGAIAALGLTRYLASLLYTVRNTDPAVYAGVAAILTIAAAAGCVFPAHRATRIDPAVVLREE
jgi:putative ABC transport system permease protein